MRLIYYHKYAILTTVTVLESGLNINGEVVFIGKSRLPEKIGYLRCENMPQATAAINELKVRSVPNA